MRNGFRRRLLWPAPSGLHPKASVLIVGSLDRPEFQAAAEWLTAHTAICTAQSVGEALQALARFPTQEPHEQPPSPDLPHAPDLIVLACARRGQFSADDVARLKAAFPLASVIALTGSWCDGPWRRTCDVLPGAWLVAWHQWSGWADLNIGRDRGHKCPMWSLPTTGAADEWAEFWSSDAIPRAGGLIAIDSADLDSAEAISESLSLAGFATAWRASRDDALIRGAVGCICDAAEMSDDAADRLRLLRAAHPQAAMVLLLSFPRSHDVQAAIAAGADLVLGKPFTVNEFLGQLVKLVSPPARGRQVESAA